MGKMRSTSTTERQAETFKATARELGCDDSEAAFEAKLRRIATAKPEPQPKKKAGPKR